MDPMFETLFRSWNMVELLPVFQAHNVTMITFLNESDHYFMSIIPSSFQLTHNFLKLRTNYISSVKQCMRLKPTANYSMLAMGGGDSSNLSSKTYRTPLSNADFHSNSLPCTGVGTFDNRESTEFAYSTSLSLGYLPNSSNQHYSSYHLPNQNPQVTNTFKTSDAESYDSLTDNRPILTDIQNIVNMQTKDNDVPGDKENLYSLPHEQMDCNDNHDLNAANPLTSDLKSNQTLIKELYSYKNFYSQVQKNMRLYKLLEGTLYGMLILYNYSKKQPINGDKLSEIVVDDFLRRTVNGSLPLVPALTCVAYLQTLAQEIERLFPKTEREALYFTGGYKVKSGDRANVRGLLYDYWSKHIKKDLMKSGFTIDPVPVTPARKEKVTNIEELNLGVLCEEYDNKKDAEITHCWQRSHDYRHNVMFQKEDINYIYTKLKVLRNNYAITLIEGDFMKLYDSYVAPEPQTIYFCDGKIWEKLTKHWTLIAKKLLKYFKTEEDQKNAEKELKEARAITKKRKGSNGAPIIESSEPPPPPPPPPESLKYEYKTDGHAAVLAFTLIHKALGYPPKPPSSVPDGTQPIKYTKSNIEASFMVHLKTEPAEGLSNYIKSENNNFKPNHPYVLVVGPFEAVKESCVVFGDIIYSCKSPTQAVDLCFKWFYSFDQKYPHICQHIYSFFQVFVYGIVDQKSKKPVAVTKIHTLGKLLSTIDIEGEPSTLCEPESQQPPQQIQEIE